ncbi:MAG TPA: hypothetical protein VEU47_12770 [Candidatus Cybelea sp.]|nr:hypothetical protein [Candidatus Cybelea sp.]
MNRFAAVAAVLACLLVQRPALAVEPPSAACAVPEDITFVGQRLDNVAERLAHRQPVRIVVLGTASSLGAGLNKPEDAYPAKLQTALARRLPSAAITVTNISKLHQSAAEMAARIPHDVLAEKPSLIIWQTGTVDAVSRVDVAEFDHAIEKGIEELASNHVDVILMDQQYSPHTAGLVNLDPYGEAMRLFAQSHDVLLFPRHEIMRYWHEDGRFGSEQDKASLLRRAEQTHGCIAELLAWMIETASRTQQ